MCRFITHFRLKPYWKNVSSDMSNIQNLGNVRLPIAGVHLLANIPDTKVPFATNTGPNDGEKRTQRKLCFSKSVTMQRHGRLCSSFRSVTSLKPVTKETLIGTIFQMNTDNVHPLTGRIQSWGTFRGTFKSCLYRKT